MTSGILAIVLEDLVINYRVFWFVGFQVFGFGDKFRVVVLY